MRLVADGVEVVVFVGWMDRHDWERGMNGTEVHCGAVVFVKVLVVPLVAAETHEPREVVLEVGRWQGNGERRV